MVFLSSLLRSLLREGVFILYNLLFDLLFLEKIKEEIYDYI
jgi:hypothetical protein